MKKLLFLGTALLFLGSMLALSTIVAISAPTTQVESSGLAAGAQIWPAAAVSPGAMQSQIAVFNTDTSGPATVSIQVVDSTGKTIATIPNFTVAVNGVVLKPLPDTVTAPFKGSALVSSDKNVQAIVTDFNSTNTARDAYAGTTAPGSALTFPLVRHLAPDTGNSIIAVQNTSSSAVNITLHLFGQNGTEVTGLSGTVATNVAPLASAYFDTNAIFGSSTFTGSGEVTADGAPLAAVEQSRYQQDTASFHGLAASDQGTTQLVSFAQHALTNSTPTSWNEIYVRNEGTSPTNVRAEYWGSGGNNTYSFTTLSPIQPNGFYVFNDSTFSALGASWTGSVKLVSLDGQPLSVYSLQVSNSGVNLFGTEASPLGQLATLQACGDFVKQSTGNSKLNLLNPTGAAANVTISLYNSDGSQAGTSKTLTIGARNLAQIGSADAGFGAPGATFEDLALVTSNVPIAVSVYTPYSVNGAAAGVTSYACAQLQSGSQPGAFTKSSPANGANVTSLTPTLSWGPGSGTVNFEYCVSTVNGTCSGNWTLTSKTSATLSALSPNSTYYWQVRAINGSGTTAANSGTWWSFKTLPPAPGAFGKSTPASGATGLATNAALTWQASTNTTYYTVCWDQINDGGCNATWVNVGNVTSYSPTGLLAGKTYYWQVRANNAAGMTPANSGTWWNFKTVSSGGPPAAFGKQSPTSGATGQPTNLSLTWQASTGATYYTVCADQNNDGQCNTSWVNVGNVTNYSPPGLLWGKTYYWQVRANNASGWVAANGGTWWNFKTTTWVGPPGAFGKLSPANGATSQPTNVTLTWQASPGVTYYMFCMDQTNNGSCDAGWTKNIGNVTSYAPAGLAAGQTYYWQVRAYNAAGWVAANGGTWWSLKTQ